MVLIIAAAAMIGITAARHRSTVAHLAVARTGELLDRRLGSFVWQGQTFSAALGLRPTFARRRITRYYNVHHLLARASPDLHRQLVDSVIRLITDTVASDTWH